MLMRVDGNRYIEIEHIYEIFLDEISLGIYARTSPDARDFLIEKFPDDVTMETLMSRLRYHAEMVNRLSASPTKSPDTARSELVAFRNEIKRSANDIQARWIRSYSKVSINTASISRSVSTALFSAWHSVVSKLVPDLEKNTKPYLLELDEEVDSA